MSSLIIATVVSLENVRRHPNADALELADVLGYQVVVPLGKYKTKDKAVYVPADAVVPDEWANRWGVKKYLRGQKNDRVGRAKLRGEPSFGLIVDIPIGENWDVGFDCTSFLGITKYEPPVKVGCGDAAERDPFVDPFFEKFTDVQNGRIFTDVLIEGEEVVFTEKIHGCFRHDAKVMLANGEERPISEITDGMNVLTYNEKTGKTEPKKVLSVVVRKDDHCDANRTRWMLLTFASGRQVTCTEKHPFLTSNGWVEANDLTESDMLIEPDIS